MTGPGEKVLLERHDQHVRIVTIDNPPVNALDEAAYRALLDAFELVAVDGSARAVVLTARGSRAFCAGTDVRDFGHQHPDRPLASLRRAKLVREAIDAVYECPVPVIACVNGPALGAGVGLLASSDVIISTTDAVLALPEVDVGVLGGTRALSKLVPQQRLRFMTYTARRVRLAELVPYGSVLAAVEPDRLLPAGIELATEIAGKSPAAIRLAKKGINHIESARLGRGDAGRFERGLTEQLAAHPDARASASAFFAHRTADFS